MIADGDLEIDAGNNVPGQKDKGKNDFVTEIAKMIC